MQRIERGGGGLDVLFIRHSQKHSLLLVSFVVRTKGIPDHPQGSRTLFHTSSNML